MRRIALEEHFVLDDPAHIDRWKSLAPNIPRSAIDKLLPPLSDVGDKRLESMSAAGVDFAILSSVASVQGDLDARSASKVARQANDYLAEVVRKHPTRYAGFATVPLQAEGAGADELERAVRELGMKGVMIFGQTNGDYLDSDRFLPFWERAEALDVPVYLHAADARATLETYAGRPELIGATWSWTAETAAHTLRIVFGGVFERFPKTRLVLGHLGETLPYLLWRLNSRAGIFNAGMRVKPGDAIRNNVSVTTAGMFSDEPFTCALAALGDDAVMFSVDHPFESMAAASSWFDAAPLTEGGRAKVSSENAARMFEL